MSVLPYLPSGVNDLPAERFVIFADKLNRIQRFAESESTYDGQAFTGFWESVTLNKQEIGRLWKFLSLRVLYFCEANATASFEFTADGGDNWTPITAGIVATTGLRTRTAIFYPNLIGEDLRFRINFGSTIYNVVAFDARIVRAGKVQYGAIP